MSKIGTDSDRLSAFSTKYLGGHTDLIGGAVTVGNVQLWKRLKVHSAAAGSLLVSGLATVLRSTTRTDALYCSLRSIRTCCTEA